MVGLLLVGGCGDDESSTNNTSIPPGAAALRDYTQAGVALLAPGLARFDALLPFVPNPDSPGATGILFEPDPEPGAPPYSYVFTVQLDGDGDGGNESTVTGRCVLSGDPGSAGLGFGGTVEFSVTSVGGLGNFTGNVAFLLTTAGTELTGTGVFTESILGYTTTITVPGTDPLLLNVATGASNSVANACPYSLDGAVEVGVEGSPGSLSALWNFFTNSRSVQVTNAVYVDPEANETPIPNSSYQIPCGSGSIQDWVGVYLQDWGCIPAEFGQAELTLEVVGSNRIRITDEDPPGSGDPSTYEATVVSANTQVLRGYFIGGPAGNHYREDFSWTRSSTGDGFSQVSIYVYQEGPAQGTGGICSGHAVRLP